jgi:hypothetical protein
MEQGAGFSICVLHWLTDKESLNILYIDGDGQNKNLSFRLCTIS